MSVQGQETLSLPRPTRWLLALLILRRSAPLMREWLADTLWPEATQERSAFYLRRSLNELRTALGDQRQRLVTPTRATLRLDLNDVFCDVVVFDRLAEAKDASSLETAIALYRGDLLEGCDAEWVSGERIRRRELYIAVLERLAEQRTQKGEETEAIQLLRLVEAADPLRETMQRRLMQIMAQAGDYIGVERQYRELRRALRNQLNMEPSGETVALYQQLRAKARMEHSSSPSLASLPREETFHNLPYPLTSLIGRTQEKQQVHSALQSARLVTLVGTGGVGKTRLSLSVGEAERPNFPTGVCFVDLTATRSHTDVQQALVTALHLQPGTNALLDALRRFLKPLRLLLILDNAEQVADACATVTDDLLRFCPNLKILCTSRQPLNVTGEVLLPLKPLAVPEESTLLRRDAVCMEDLMECESVTLLLERVLAASPGFRLDAANAPVIAAICRHLEGLPLALELIAARFRSLPAQEIAARLDMRFRLLDRGNSLLPRHRTLHDTLDWSYDLLTEAERRLLRHLSVFRGGWTLEAAEAICPEEQDTVVLLASLVDKSLVVYETQDGQKRYRLLEMTRQYAIERLEESERASIEQRHAEYFYRMLQSADTNTTQKHLIKKTFALALERDNFRAAHTWYQRHDTLLALWMEFFLYWIHVWVPETPTERIWELERQPLPPTPLGVATTYLVCEAALWGKHPACEILLLRLLEHARFCNDRNYQRAAWDLLSNLEDEHGNFERSQDYVEEWLRIASVEVNAYAISAHRSKIALCMARTGQVERAIQRLELQIHEEREQEEWQSLNQTLITLSEILQEQEMYAAAQSCLTEALSLAPVWAPQLLPNLWRFQAQAAMALKDYSHAWRCLEEALVLSQRNGQLDRQGWTRWEMAELAFREGDKQAAEAHLRECILLFHAMNEPDSMVRCLVKLAKFCIAWEQYSFAATLLGSADRAFKEYGFRRTARDQAWFKELTAQVCNRHGDEAWQADWERGRLLTLLEAIHFAMSSL